MLKKILLGFIICFCCNTVFAQLKLKRMVVRKTAEASLMFNGGLYNTAARGVGANIHYLWGMGRNRQRINLGFGVRHYSFWSQKREYETADRNYTKNRVGGSDSIYFDKMQSNILNGYFAFMFNIKRGVILGINLDLGGVTFGGTKDGLFHSYELTNTDYKKVQVAPFAFNLNDAGTGAYGYGSTFNQLYLQFRGGQIMRYRLGLDLFRNEVNATVPIVGNGTRFVNNNILLNLGLVWNIRHNKSRYDIWTFQD